MPSSSMEISAPVSSVMALMVLPLRANELTDLRSRNLDRGDLRGELADRSSGPSITLSHGVEDLLAGCPRLLQGIASTFEGIPSSLVSSWQRSDELRGTGDLEVHIAKGILGTEDVSEGYVTGFLTLDLAGDQTHGNASDGRLQGHTRIVAS